LALVVFAASLAWGLYRLSSRLDLIHASESTGTWIAVQAETEYLRLLDVLDRYGHGDPAAGRDELVQRFEIFWSRLPLISIGVEAQQLRTIPGLAEQVAAMIDTLESVEPELLALAPGDAGALATVRARLAPFGAPLHELTRKALLEVETEYMRGRMEAISVTLLGPFVGVLVSAAAFILLLARQIGHSEQRAAQLLDSQRRLAEAERFAHLGNWEWNPRSNRHVWSAETSRVLGLPPDQPASHEAFIAALHPEDRDWVLATIEQAFKDGRRYDIEFRIVRPDGDVRHVHSFGEVVRGEDGQVLRDFGTVQDVTERKLAEKALSESRQQLQTVIDAVPAMVNAKTPDSRYVFMNRYQADLYGVTPEEAIGKTAGDILGEEYGERTAAVDREVMASGVARRNYEEDWVDAAGNPIVLLTTKVPLIDGDGRVGGVVTVALDISDRRRADVALRAAKEEAELANQAKTEFLANVSHELRTPLNSIIGFSEILASEAHGPVGSPRNREYARDINESGRHLLELINDILDVSRIEKGALLLQDRKLDVARLVASCRRLVRERAESRGLRFACDVDPALPALVADELRVRQILINLLSNAIKFTPRGGEVTLTAAVNGDDCFEFSVSDTGIGIAPENLKKVLLPFRRGDAWLRRRYEGAGLGLPISRQLAEMHGGELTLDSRVGGGTRVTVRFPRERTARPG
jgi:two-component system cell cycle sensor histidine kinase PleC